MKFLKIADILALLNNCIEYKLPFSHIRFGDGGLKFISSMLDGEFKQLNVIAKKEGLPNEKLVEIFELWGYYARQATCIDTPQVYFGGKFWPRIKKPGKPINIETERKMRAWRTLYSRAEFDNDVYCNPESNCLLVLEIEGQKNIFDIMRGRKICIITARPEVVTLFPGYDIDILPIVGQWEGQYDKNFNYVVDYIIHMARHYDFWMVAAGELGRIYSGLIKECGGRSVDMGFVVEYWLDGYLHPRFHTFINKAIENRFILRLTQQGREYERFI
jgi:hypothetical protein